MLRYAEPENHSTLRHTQILMRQLEVNVGSTWIEWQYFVGHQSILLALAGIQYPETKMVCSVCGWWFTIFENCESCFWSTVYFTSTPLKITPNISPEDRSVFLMMCKYRLTCEFDSFWSIEDPSAWPSHKLNRTWDLRQTLWGKLEQSPVWSMISGWSSLGYRRHRKPNQTSKSKSLRVKMIIQIAIKEISWK